MNAEVTFRYAEPVMGTVVSFDVRPRGIPHEVTQAALTSACGLLHKADEIFSLYRERTPLSRFRRGELTLDRCPPELHEVFALCAKAREQSDGWFDPWAMQDGFDPTGLVKGWAAARAAGALQQAGAGAGMVNAAGDIAVFGRPPGDRPWRVGVRSPQAPDRLLCVIAAEAAVATSGTYERGDHVRHPRTGCAACAALSATVCGPDLAFADAFATGLLAAGEDGLAAVHDAGYSALLVLADGSQSMTQGFPLLEPEGSAHCDAGSTAITARRSRAAA